MSSLIFPSLPGVKINVRRRPVFATKVQTTASGRELRATWQSAPRTRYGLSFEFLRSASAHNEFQRMANFIARHAGQYDSFLFSDPEDNAVTNHGFGVGNNATTAFQLQRTLGVTVQDVLGSWPQYTKPRKNMVLRSQEFDHASWTKGGAGTATAASVVANFGEAPDGTITADLVKLRLNGGTSVADYSIVTQSVGVVIGRQYVASVWLRTTDGTSKIIALEAVGGSGGNITVTPTWQRFSSPWTATLATGALVFLIHGSRGNADSVNLLAWGAQYEEGVLATRYIATTTAAVTAAPAYWPAIGDGFEPVYDPAPGAQLFLADAIGARTLSPAPRTNNLLRSEELGTSPWSTSNCSMETNETTAPDGTETADKIVEDSATAEHRIGQDFTVGSNQSVVYSCYLKAGERTKGYLFIADKAGGYPGVRYNLVTGVVETQNGGALGTIESIGGGWYRCIMSASSGSGAVQTRVRIATVNAAGAVTYAGDGISGIYAWGAQIEYPAIGIAATSYIKTTSAAVTVTDYTLGANGTVTLGVAPAAGASLSWTGSYYRRVRLASDEIEAERVVNQIWETKTVELISVKP
jgi:hypothetical protein